eukprot:m51a1_g12581 hypothetical protein (619) ;mRNA; f:1243-4005
MDFSVESTVELIRSSGARKVALQFPEGLLAHADGLAKTFEQRLGVEVVILADCTYGACCIDDELTKALGASLLVHYGHARVVPDEEAPKSRVAYVHVTAPAGDGVALAEAAAATLPPHSRVVLCSTAQFLPAAGVAVGALEARGFTAKLIPTSGGDLREGEVLGCTAHTLPVGSADAILYVGDGRFHVEAAAIANPTIPTYRYDPYTEAFTLEAHDVAGLALARKRAIAKARSAKLVGIAVSTLGRQANPRALQRVRSLLDRKGIKNFTVLLSDVSPQALDAFGPVDVWVQVACPRLSIDWGDSFSAPLLTSYEAIAAFDDGVAPFEDTYPLDNWAKPESHFCAPHSPTRTEAIFAALQGPVLRLSSPVVCMYRSYTLELLLPRRWRLARGLSASALCSALADAQVVRADTLAREPVRCRLCGPVLSLADVHSNPAGVPDELESYCASVRALCSSSRRHLRVRELAVAVALGPGFAVESSSFVVRARDRGQQASNCSASPPPPVVDPALMQPAGQPWQCGFCVAVEVMRPVLPPVLPLGHGQEMTQGLATILQTLPGFLMQKTTMSGGFFITVRAYRTVDDAEQGSQMVADYSSNVIRNTLNRDTQGAVVRLAAIHNW